MPAALKLMRGSGEYRHGFIDTHGGGWDPEVENAMESEGSVSSDEASTFETWPDPRILT
jgi:hypothetical protein